MERRVQRERPSCEGAPASAQRPVSLTTSEWGGSNSSSSPSPHWSAHWRTTAARRARHSRLSLPLCSSPAGIRTPRPYSRIVWIRPSFADLLASGARRDRAPLPDAALCGRLVSQPRLPTRRGTFARARATQLSASRTIRAAGASAGWPTAQPPAPGVSPPGDAAAPSAPRHPTGGRAGSRGGRGRG
jgi:hypothetical protein